MKKEKLFEKIKCDCGNKKLQVISTGENSIVFERILKCSSCEKYFKYQVYSGIEYNGFLRPNFFFKNLERIVFNELINHKWYIEEKKNF